MSPPSDPRKLVEKAVRAGELTKPESCEKCGRTPSGRRQIKAHIPNPDSPLDVIWMCQSCFILTNPSLYRGTHLVKRKQNIKKAPPYKRMKADFAAGWTYDELAERWGISCGASAWHLMRARAQAHGEWPLPKVRKKIRVDVIWDLVRSEIAKQTECELVVVAQKEADRFAPFCRFRRRVKDGGLTRKEVWPSSTQVRYHRAFCIKLRPAGDLVFAINRSNAEDWGYEECKICAKGISLERYAEKNGFNVDWVYSLSSGRTKYVSLAQARALLSSIGEPIPDSLWTPAERAKATAAAQTPRSPSVAATAPSAS